MNLQNFTPVQQQHNTDRFKYVSVLNNVAYMPNNYMCN